MVTATRILTYEEWLALPPVEDGTDEVVKGELRFMPPNHFPRAEIFHNLIDQVIPQINKKEVRILGRRLA